MAMTIIETLEDRRIFPAPSNRLRVFESDEAAEDYFAVDDLTLTEEYEHKVTYSSRE